MKVAVYRKYGPPDVVQIENVQKPVPKDKEVLINGATQGLGTFAVQIAKSFGAEVAGVCSTRNVI